MVERARGDALGVAGANGIDAALVSPDVSEQIRALALWFHNLHLPSGQQTAPDHWLGDFPRYKWERLAPFLPPDLKGWTTLDVGCNARYYSIELARRGASVHAIDIDPHYLRQARWQSGSSASSRRSSSARCKCTNWRAAGLRVIARPGEEIYLCEPDPNFNPS